MAQWVARYTFPSQLNFVVIARWLSRSPGTLPPPLNVKAPYQLLAETLLLMKVRVKDRVTAVLLPLP